MSSNIASSSSIRCLFSSPSTMAPPISLDNTQPTPQDPSLTATSLCTTKSVTCSQRWTIDNFSQFATDAYCGQYPKLLSSKFTTHNNYKQLQFYLDLRPRGDSSENNDYVSLFLSSEGKGERSINCTMSVIDGKGRKRSTKASLRKDVADNADYGYYRFISHRELLNKDNDLLPNDQLTVFVEVSILVVESQTPERALHTLLEKETESTVVAAWGSLFEASKCADIKINLPNRRHLMAHKAVLVNRSPVFEAMFSADMKEKQTNEVDIKEFSHDVIKVLLGYLYTGKIAEHLDKYATELFEAADKYQLDDLKAICEEALCLQATGKPKTATKLLRLAILYGAEKLTIKAQESIRKYNREKFDEVLENPELLLEMDEIMSTVTKRKNKTACLSKKARTK